MVRSTVTMPHKFVIPKPQAKVNVLGKVKAITYRCSVSTEHGACKADEGALYRHEFKQNFPLLAYGNDKYHFLCRVKFHDGFFKKGIDDLDDGENKMCSVIVKDPNPSEYKVVGELTRVDLTNGRAFAFSNSILCVNKAGDRLFIVDAGKITKENPITPFPELGETPSTFKQEVGRAYWSMLHNFCKIYDPSTMKQVAKNVVEEMIAHYPCSECGRHGMEYIKQNPPNYDSKEALAKWSWSFHNAVNKGIGKAGDYKWEDVEKEIGVNGCHDGTCQIHNVPDGLVLWTQEGCSHCKRMKETLGSIKYREIDALKYNKMTGMPQIEGTPYLELRKNGQVVNSHLGAMSLSEVKEFLGEN